MEHFAGFLDQYTETERCCWAERLADVGWRGSCTLLTATAACYQGSPSPHREGPPKTQDAMHGMAPLPGEPQVEQRRGVSTAAS